MLGCWIRCGDGVAGRSGKHPPDRKRPAVGRSRGRDGTPVSLCSTNQNTSEFRQAGVNSIKRIQTAAAERMAPIGSVAPVVPSATDPLPLRQAGCAAPAGGGRYPLPLPYPLVTGRGARPGGVAPPLQVAGHHPTVLDPPTATAGPPGAVRARPTRHGHARHGHATAPRRGWFGPVGLRRSQRASCSFCGGSVGHGWRRRPRPRDRSAGGHATRPASPPEPS